MYLVPGMKLIAQQKNMSCWYASAQMVIQWKRGQTLQTSSNLADLTQTDMVKTIGKYTMTQAALQAAQQAFAKIQNISLFQYLS